MGTGASFLGVKPPKREPDNSAQSSAKDKEWVELYLYFPNTSSKGRS
jgi:hypothetical protein